MANPGCGMAQLVDPRFWKGMLNLRWGGRGIWVSLFIMVNPVYVSAVLIDVICVSLCFFLSLSFSLLLLLPLCSSGFSLSTVCLLLSPPLFLLFLCLSFSVTSASLSCLLSFLFPTTRCRKAAALCFKVWLKPLCLASAVGKNTITNPHYRHPSLSSPASPALLFNHLKWDERHLPSFWEGNG